MISSMSQYNDNNCMFECENQMNLSDLQRFKIVIEKIKNLDDLEVLIAYAQSALGNISYYYTKYYEMLNFEMLLNIDIYDNIMVVGTISCSIRDYEAHLIKDCDPENFAIIADMVQNGSFKYEPSNTIKMDTTVATRCINCTIKPNDNLDNITLLNTTPRQILQDIRNWIDLSSECGNIVSLIVYDRKSKIWSIG